MTLDVSPGMFLALPMLLARVKVLAHARRRRRRRGAGRGGASPALAWSRRRRGALILGHVVLGEAELSHDDLDGADRWASRRRRGC